MTLRYSTDIVIFGGGIAGLWLLNRLHNEGYQAILSGVGNNYGINFKDLFNKLIFNKIIGLIYRAITQKS